jgi:hypothetical protein
MTAYQRSECNTRVHSSNVGPSQQVNLVRHADYAWHPAALCLNVQRRLKATRSDNLQHVLESARRVSVGAVLCSRHFLPHNE